MSSYIIKKFYRRKGFLLFLFLILVVNILFYSINNATSNLEDFAKNSWINYVGDIRISGNLNEEFLNELSSQSYISSATGLALVYSTIKFNNQSYSALFVYCSNPKGLMGYEILEGNNNSLLYLKGGKINLKINDEIFIATFNHTIKVSGIASAFYNFGLVDLEFVVNKDFMHKLGKNDYTYIFAKLKGEISDLENKLKSIANETNSKIDSIIALDPNAFPGKEDIEAAKNVFNIFVIILLLVIFVALSAYQFIYLETNDKEIDYLRAIGLTNRQIIFVHALPLILIFAVGSIAGTLIAFPLSKILFDSALRSTPITFSEILLNRFVFHAKIEALLYSYSVLLMIFLLTLIPVTIYISRKKESIVKGGSKFLRRTSLIPKLVLFSSSTRLWRILLIILLFALLIASNAAVASIINNWDSSVKELNNFYDYFIYAIGYSELPKINNATILVATFHLAKVYDKSVVTASFIQLSNVSPKLLEGRWPSKAGEATVSITLAKDLNLKLGDEVLYSIGLKNYTFKVVGIAFIPLFYLYTRETESIILNYDDYAKIFGRSEAFAIYLKGNVEQVLNELKSKGFSTYYRTKDESIKIASEGGRIALIFLNFLTITLTLSSALLISIIIFSELYSRSKEYAVFILIGYRIKDILFLIAFSLLILAIISLPISYFMLIFLSILLKNQIIAFTGYFDISINFIDILINLQYIILPILIVFIANYRYLKRLNIYKILLQ